MNYKYEAIDAINLINNNDDLREVWNRLKIKWDENNQKTLANYKVGDHVVMTSRNQKLYPAIVEKVNKKTVSIVLTGDYEGTRYRVSPTYINHN